MARSYWTIPIHADRGREPFDLIRNGRARLDRSRSVGSRSNGPRFVDQKRAARSPEFTRPRRRHGRRCALSRSRGLRDEQILPRRSGRRGGVGCAAVVVGVASSSSHRSSELLAAAVPLGRGRIRRLAAKRGTRPCQKDAQGRRKTRGGDERVRDDRGAPYGDLLAGGNGGGGNTIPSALAVERLGFWARGNAVEVGV